MKNRIDLIMKNRIDLINNLNWTKLIFTNNYSRMIVTPTPTPTPTPTSTPTPTPTPTPTTTTTPTPTTNTTSNTPLSFKIIIYNHKEKILEEEGDIGDMGGLLMVYCFVYVIDEKIESFYDLSDGDRLVSDVC